MNPLLALLFATFALASPQRLLRRNLFFGGSESRFIMGPPVSKFVKPKLALGVEAPHKYGQEVVLMERNDRDRYQKFRVQDTDQGVYIRFDNHPQPGIRTRDGDNKIEMYNADWDAHGEWMITVVAIWQNNDFVEPPNELEWNADSMSKIGRLRVTVWNKAKNAFLRVNGDGQPEMLFLDVHDHEKMNDHDWIRSQKLLWEINYVTSAWSASQVRVAVLGPAAVIGTIASAVYVAPAVLLASFGIIAPPTMAVIGSAAASGAEFVVPIIVSAIVWAAATDVYEG